MSMYHQKEEPHVVKLLLPGQLQLKSFSLAFEYDVQGEVAFQLDITPSRKRRSCSDLVGTDIPELDDEDGNDEDGNDENGKDTLEENMIPMMSRMTLERVDMAQPQALSTPKMDLHTLLQQRRQRTRGKKPAIKVYARQNSSAGIVKSYQHASYQVHSDGLIGWKRKRIVPSQRRLAATPQRDPLQDVPLPVIPDIVDDNPPDLDPDIHNQPKRKRKASVSTIDNLSMESAHLHA
ncbi:hypothetical protein PAXINDRAFT_157716 [Paxillus involutus ATCC 200175]|uniref:Uncharacterized protein n=1 Tax=Paxillus involutus ATCC 200175 TaxID=664439 RepID=A0A0C9SQZ6_PAXIN|nr:hypothetical protein PAXINDRAFT_157716 [Paxillus involutus ATCC 200175]